jgi:hypothetical protein
VGIFFDSCLERKLMGSKNKRIKKEIKKLLKGNKVLFAALGGAAAGITIAGIFGTEKGKEILDTVEDSIAKNADRISNGHLNSATKDFSNGMK